MAEQLIEDSLLPSPQEKRKEFLFICESRETVFSKLYDEVFDRKPA